MRGAARDADPTLTLTVVALNPRGSRQFGFPSQVSPGAVVAQHPQSLRWKVTRSQLKVVTPGLS